MHREESLFLCVEIPNGWLCLSNSDPFSQLVFSFSPPPVFPLHLSKNENQKEK